MLSGFQLTTLNFSSLTAPNISSMLLVAGNGHIITDDRSVAESQLIDFEDLLSGFQLTTPMTFTTRIQAKLLTNV